MNTRLPFDPDAFMSTTIDQPLETERKLVPEGEYLNLMVDDFTSDAFETFSGEYQKGPNIGQQWSMTKFNCPVIVNDDKVKQFLNTDKPRVYYTCVLDFDENGQLDFGVNRNLQLGQLRKAVGQNQAGVVWMPSMLRGAGPFAGKLVHRPGKRKDGSPFIIAEFARLSPIK